MRRGIPVLMVFILSSLLIILPGHAQDKGDELYVIKKGDTLWDLSDEFLDDPYQWPELWQRNQYITNPHLIYPGNSIRLRGRVPSLRPEREGRAVTEAQPVQGKDKAADTQQVVEEREGVPSDKELEAMLRPEDMDAAQVIRKGRVEYVIFEEDSLGTIIDARYQKRLLAQSDIVYLAMKERAPEIGERFLIFRTMKKLRNPYTRKKTRKIYILGALKVKAIKGAFYQAEITDSFDAIWRGDEIMTYREVQ